MKKLKFLILIFCITVFSPLAFVILQTYSGLEQEEMAQMRFFAEELFDQMEKDLAFLVQQEEGRSVDEYGYYLASPQNNQNLSLPLSPLAKPSNKEYILGYLQNNPDGSFQTPLTADMGSVPEDLRSLVKELREANQTFNKKKFLISAPIPSPALKLKKDSIKAKGKEKVALQERYLKSAKRSDSQDYLGKKRQRIEEITPEQAYKITNENESFARSQQQTESTIFNGTVSAPSVSSDSITSIAPDYDQDQKIEGLNELMDKESFTGEPKLLRDSARSFQVEIAPFQSVGIDGQRIYIFRRIGMNNQMYRQGFIILLRPLMHYLLESYFINQPLAGFSSLQLASEIQGLEGVTIQAGVPSGGEKFAGNRVFPAPFDFLSMSLLADTIPVSSARTSLNLAIVLLALFLLSGLYIIFRSVRSIVAMSERRSQFVSSVTHELKTPLTNIRMYVEMLEQGIASTPMKELEYLGIVSSESTRLSGLINNVLELAKLEKNTRQFSMQPGNLALVFTEVETIMAEQLKQEGFTLVVKKTDLISFSFDREVLAHILMNLMENSLKFGKNCPKKLITIGAESQKEKVLIHVSDTGPGIPRRELSKIFDDFYRVDNSLTRATGGTGIGLALVKKFVTAMNGTVSATNNNEAGCTITITLPVNP